eukprot:gene8861-18358_t
MAMLVYAVYFSLLAFSEAISVSNRNATNVSHNKRSFPHSVHYRTNTFFLNFLSGTTTNSPKVPINEDKTNLRSNSYNKYSKTDEDLQNSLLEYSYGKVKTATFYPTSNPTQIPSFAPVHKSVKKGIAIADDNGEFIYKVNPLWYYNWRSEPTPNTAPHIPFVPMIWGRGIGPVMNASIVLGFNEPDRSVQANLTPKEALELWPKTVTAGASIVGSPSPALIENYWLPEFLNGAVAMNHKVDFICVHRYPWPESKSFLQFIDSVYGMYKMPIWVTEFAVADWFITADDEKSTRYTEQQVIKFMHEVLPALEAKPFVERYSWFSADINDPNLWFSALYKEDGSLTELGKVYAEY